MRVFHTADIHLGAEPDKGYPWSYERAAGIWDTFERLIDRVRDERPELLAISGDLFHSVPDEKQIRRVGRLFASIPETAVAFCAGNHDHITADSWYLRYDWSKNVYPLLERELTSAAIGNIDTRVYGLSYYRTEEFSDLYKNAKPYGKERYHILLMHAGDRSHSPIDSKAVAGADFDYIALGHIHKKGFVHKNKAAFSGALEPLDRNDMGTHGYIEVELEGNKRRVSFVPLAGTQYKKLDIYLDQNDTISSAEDKIIRAAASHGKENVYSVTISGDTDKAELLELKRLWNSARITEIKKGDESIPDYESLCIRYRGTIIEEFIRSFDGCDDELSKEALEAGTRAFLRNLTG